MVIGAPSRIAATPPTMTCSTEWRSRTRSSSRKLEAMPTAEGARGVDQILYRAQTFGRCLGQHPLDDRDVHTILVVDPSKRRFTVGGPCRRWTLLYLVRWHRSNASTAFRGLLLLDHRVEERLDGLQALPVALDLARELGDHVGVVLRDVELLAGVAAQVVQQRRVVLDRLVRAVGRLRDEVGLPRPLRTA